MLTSNHKQVYNIIIIAYYSSVQIYLNANIKLNVLKLFIFPRKEQARIVKIWFYKTTID